MEKATVDATCDIRVDPRRTLYILMAGAEDGGPSARAARQAQDEKLARFLLKVQEEVIEVAKERLAHREAEKESAPRETYEGTLPDKEESAERAARRLEAVADRLEQESRGLGVVDGETLARSQELRVAAFMVRDEAKVVSRREQLLLRAAEERDKVGVRALADKQGREEDIG